MIAALDEAKWLVTALPIKLFGDPILVQPCTKISADEFKSGQAVTWAEQMANFMTSYRQHTGVGRGLAANQIGVPKRLIWVWNGNQAIYFVNPVVKQTKGEAVYPESCISAASLIIGDVKRAWSITVDFQDLEGKHQRQNHDGLTARLLQHEIDHLNGRICSDQYLPGTIKLRNGDANQFLTAQFQRIS